MGRSRGFCTFFVGCHHGPAAVQNSVVIPVKTERRCAVGWSNSIAGSVSKRIEGRDICTQTDTGGIIDSRQKVKITCVHEQINESYTVVCTYHTHTLHQFRIVLWL